VHDSVGVTAVLLTQPSVRRLFGREIADTYAVVELIISNRSADAAFVIHSAYIDTSQWALGGGTRGYSFDSAPSNDPDEVARAGTHPNRIASVESRVARGQLLDAQLWSARNWTVRLLTVAGEMAAGYSFAFKETGIAKGISAFNGALVPGVAFAWPDGAVAQQNRISDFGYQTNKIIGKQGSDIMVCFFPIDMFLSAPIRQLFLKSPGLFLSPYQILFTPENGKVRMALGITDPDEEKENLRAKGRGKAKDEIQDKDKAAAQDKVKDKDTNRKPTLQELRDLHVCYSKMFEGPRIKKDSKNRGLLDEGQDAIEAACKRQLTDSPKALVELDYIGRFGLQNVAVYVDGIMTVDIDTVPASIDHVVFDTDATKADFWAASGQKTGTIQCRFCENGQVSILEADKLGITDVTAATDGSSPNTLKVSFKTTKPIEPGQSLTFVITKKPADPKKSGQEVKSAPFVYTIAYVEVTPSIAKVAIEDKKVTVTGSGFFDTKANPLAVLLHSDGKDKDVSVTLSAGQAPDKLTFDVPAGLGPGCWNVHVKVGTMEASAPNRADQKILSAATSKLTEAARNGAAIVVKGTQLVDTSGCKDSSSALSFNFVPASAGATATLLTITKYDSSEQVTLAVPAGKTVAPPGKVHVFQGTTDIANADLK
jgi:hypothetical protein